MPEAWDTSLASKLHPGARYEGVLAARRRGSELLAVTAPTVFETIYGLAREGRAQPLLREALAWYRRLFAGSVMRVLPLDGAAAVLAGELRARQPLPPVGKRRGSKPDRRVAWILDVQIAATAWTAGYSVATENRSDFEALGEMIGKLYPGFPPLEVAGPPEALQAG